MDGLQGQEIPIIVAAGILIMLGMALALVFFYNRAQRKLLAQRIEAKELVLQKTIQAQEAERSRIARELHDDLGSKLNVAYLHTQRLRKDEAVDQSIVQEITSVLNISIDSTRRISHELLPPTLSKFGLMAAIVELAEGYEKTQRVKFDLQLDHIDEAVAEEEKALNLFRILQELTKNSVLHGSAKNIIIHFISGSPQHRILYKEDGKGARPEALDQGKGLGMENIKSRLKIIGGGWNYTTAPGEGLEAEILF
jgi:signal transduction histidine kinase